MLRQVYIIAAVIIAALSVTDAPLAADARVAPSPAVAVNTPPSQSGSVVVSSSGADFESTPLVFPANTRQNSRQGQRSGMVQSIFSAIFYVLVICAVFAAIIWLVKRYLPGHKQLFNHPSMEVLGRTHLDQRRYVSLVRVGRRILVVGVSPDSISSLSEVTDGAEVAEILEQARPKTEAGKSVFQKLFQRHVVEVEQARAEGDFQEKKDALIGDMAALRNRLQTQGQGGDKPAGIDRVG